jgi:D-aminoacyl-tRNA deacylase
MKIVAQRVTQASVSVDNKTISTIDKGLVLLVGIEKGDTLDDISTVAAKICRLRIFEDENGKMNLDINQVEGKILSVSQFTLAGCLNKGNRPGFDNAADPVVAEKLWEAFNDVILGKGIVVEKGKFGAKMDVKICNDGPVTFVVST